MITKKTSSTAEEVITTELTNVVSYDANELAGRKARAQDDLIMLDKQYQIDKQSKNNSIAEIDQKLADLATIGVVPDTQDKPAI